MTYVEKIVKQAKGIKVDPEIVKGLKAVEEMHELAKKVKGSPSKTYEESYEPSK